MKLELNKFKLKQVLLSAFVLLISFGAAATATFAWFTVNRNANLGNSNISIDQSVEDYTLKYYKGNYTTEDGETKYTGYQDYGKISSCNYATEFVEMNDSGRELWNITDMFPDTRYTFAFELTISSGSQISRAGLAITKYKSTNFTATSNPEDRLTMYKVNPNNTEEVLGGIYLSEAINIYAAGMLKQDNASMDKASLNFLNGFELGNRTKELQDVFRESGDGTGFDAVDLAYVNAPSLSGKTIVVFFTIEFSNASDTYYTYSHRDNNTNNIYYYKDTVNGSSNCYQLLSFSVTALSLFAN